MITCGKCGKKNKDNAVVCAHCGAPLTEVAKAEALGMNYHKIMIVIKFLLASTAVTSFFMTFTQEANTLRLVAQIFYVIEFVLLCISLIRHKHKDGVWWFVAWGIVEFVYQIVTNLVGLQLNLTTSAQAIEKLIIYGAGTMALLIPTIIYYHKRKAVLKG